MTDDDMVTIPRELAERIYADMAFGAAANELAAILNPPPFDPAVSTPWTQRVFRRRRGRVPGRSDR